MLASPLKTGAQRLADFNQTPAATAFSKGAMLVMSTIRDCLREPQVLHRHFVSHGAPRDKNRQRTNNYEHKRT